MKKNQTAVISGASSGIGSATAVKFSNEGYDLILLGRNQKRLEETKSNCNTQVKVELLDFDLSQIQKNKTKILKTFDSTPNITVLVNNAGIFQMGGLLEHSPEDWQSQFTVNLLGPVQLTQLIWPYFMKNKKGSIVNVSSTLGINPTATTGAYSAIKAAMNNWTISLAQEGGEHNIRANCICPGLVDTPIHSFHHLNSTESEKTKQTLGPLHLLGRIGQPEEVAESIYFLASDHSRWTTGSILSVDGGIAVK